jgi:hypothetical protein
MVARHTYHEEGARRWVPSLESIEANSGMGPRRNAVAGGPKTPQDTTEPFIAQSRNRVLARRDVCDPGQGGPMNVRACERARANGEKQIEGLIGLTSIRAADQIAPIRDVQCDLRRVVGFAGDVCIGVEEKRWARAGRHLEETQKA